MNFPKFESKVFNLNWLYPLSLVEVSKSKRNIVSEKKIWIKTQKEILGPQKFWVQNNCVYKKIWEQTKIFGLKFFWSKNRIFGSQINLGSEKYLGSEKNCWSNKCWFQKILVQKNFRPIKIKLGPAKIWANVARTNVTWSVGISSRCSHEPTFKVWSKSGQ